MEQRSRYHILSGYVSPSWPTPRLCKTPLCWSRHRCFHGKKYRTPQKDPDLLAIEARSLCNRQKTLNVPFRLSRWHSGPLGQVSRLPTTLWPRFLEVITPRYGHLTPVDCWVTASDIRSWNGPERRWMLYCQWWFPFSSCRDTEVTQSWFT